MNLKFLRNKKRYRLRLLLFVTNRNIFWFYSYSISLLFLCVQVKNGITKFLCWIQKSGRHIPFNFDMDPNSHSNFERLLTDTYSICFAAVSLLFNFLSFFTVLLLSSYHFISYHATCVYILLLLLFLLFILSFLAPFVCLVRYTDRVLKLQRNRYTRTVYTIHKRIEKVSKAIKQKWTQNRKSDCCEMWQRLKIYKFSK